MPVSGSAGPAPFPGPHAGPWYAAPQPGGPQYQAPPQGAFPGGPSPRQGFGQHPFEQHHGAAGSGPAGPVRGSLEIRDRVTVPGLTATASRARAPAISPGPASTSAAVRALRRVRASPRRVAARSVDHLGTRHRRPASSTARWGRGLVLPSGRTMPDQCRRAGSPQASRRPRKGRCRPATTPRARRSRARRALASSLSLISSLRRASSWEARRSRSGTPWSVRSRLGGLRRAGILRRAVSPRAPPASQVTRSQGRAIRPTPILTGC